MKRYMLVFKIGKEEVLKHINHYCGSCRNVEGADWKRCLVNPENGIIFCEWEAEGADAILDGIREVGITEIGEIIEVECLECDSCCGTIFGEVDSMELYDAIGSRRSVYNFKSDEVADELILRVLEAGTMAPSAFNTQPWEFILVKDSATRIETAPMLLIVAYTPDEKLGDDIFASCFTAIENILLALAVEGLAGVIFAFRNKKLKELLGLDEGMQIAAVIPLGIPAEKPGERKVIGIENKVHIDKFKGGEVK